jgi:hypothetical protein
MWSAVLRLGFKRRKATCPSPLLPFLG